MMANFSGTLIAGALYAATSASVGITADYDARTYPAWPRDAFSGSTPLAGTKTNTQPITESPVNKSATRVPAFNDDYYNRIHYSVLSFDLGNVITTTTRTIMVWNAYVEPKTLQAISETGTDGIIFGQPVIPPATYTGLQEQTYQFTITTDGPPIISAGYTYTWAAANNATITITGSRINAWVWRPNWARAITERLAWLTDVQRAYDGSEQRIRVRATPRRSLEFEYLIEEGAARRRFDALLWDWQSRIWSLPLWTDGQSLTAPVTSGDITIAATTTDYDFSVGGQAMLINLDTLDNEVVEVNAVSAGQIGILRPLTNSWPAGTWLFPAKSARLSSNHRLTRFIGNTVYAVATFQFTDSSSWPKATESITYRGYPVFTGQNDWSIAPTEDFSRTLETIDNASGKWSIDDQTGRPNTSLSHLWSAYTRADISALRSWLYSRQGRLTMFWQPTGNDDLAIVSPISSSSPNIDIEWVGYTKFYQMSVNRRDIRIETTGGMIYDRRITGSVEVDATTERLTLDSVIGVDLAVTDIARISFMVLRRLNADNLEIAWWTGQVATCKFDMMSIDNDI